MDQRDRRKTESAFWRAFRAAALPHIDDAPNVQECDGCLDCRGRKLESVLVGAEELGRRIGGGRHRHKAIIGVPKLAWEGDVLTVDVLYATGAA